MNDSMEMDEDEEQKLEMIHENMTTFSMVEIQGPNMAFERCRFQYEWKQGMHLYMSYPYLLVFDGNSAKLLQVQAAEGNVFCRLRPLGTFVDDQCKLPTPTYFSPDFMHRIYINEDKEIVINYTLENIDLIKCDFKKKIMFQKKKTHPMFYFHNNDEIVYLSKAGVEKLFKFVKVPDRNKRFTNCYLEEISNISYNDK